MNARYFIHPGNLLRVVTLALAGLAGSAFAQIASNMPSHASSSTTSSKTEFVTLGGGCFWCLEAMYETLPGVKGAVSGYAGGQVDNPTYKQVCGGETGHAEVVQIEYDPAQISFEKLLEAFWDAHDPTTLNRQGNDVGTQYRSIILYQNDAQKAAAEKAKAAAQKDYTRPIVTEIVSLKKFYPAEGYHQDYFRQNPGNGYCQMVIAPKLKRFKSAQSGTGGH